MEAGEFQNLAIEALEALPAEFRQKLDNVDIVVQDYPLPSQLAKARVRRGTTLLGLYEGVPRTRRGMGYTLVMPDKITLFQKPIEARCRSDSEIKAEVARVLRHEIAHHFGIGEATLAEIERAGHKPDFS